MTKALKIAGLIALVQLIILQTALLIGLAIGGAALVRVANALGHTDTVTSTTDVPTSAPSYSPEECNAFASEPDSMPAECKSRGPK